MPMYTCKPFEARQAVKETIADISNWCGLDEDLIVEGHYYTACGLEYWPDEFEESFEEIE